MVHPPTHRHKHTSASTTARTQMHAYTQLGEQHPSHVPAKWGSLLCEPPAAVPSSRSTHHLRGSDTEWDVLDPCPCTPLGLFRCSAEWEAGGQYIIFFSSSKMEEPQLRFFFFWPKEGPLVTKHGDYAIWKWKEVSLYQGKEDSIFSIFTTGLQLLSSRMPKFQQL